MPSDVGRLKLFLCIFLFASIDGEQIRGLVLRSKHFWLTHVASNDKIVVALFGILASGNTCPWLWSTVGQWCC